ncbi:hypothetical protein [Burkholderia lata]|nr:hypothetical protein [Burkholderia lata]
MYRWLGGVVPVNLKLIPPIYPVPSKQPSLFFMLMIFTVFALSGVALTLLLWPGRLAKEGAVFWMAMVGIPVGIGFLVALIPYWRHAGKLREWQARHDIREQRKSVLYAYGQRPLSILSAMFVVSSIDDENSVDGIASGKLRLESRMLPDRKRSMRARWLAAPDFEEGQSVEAYDEDRQRKAIQVGFKRVIKELGPTLRKLPDGIPRRVELDLHTLISQDECGTLWKEAWDEQEMPYAEAVVQRAQASVMRLDAWLDTKDADLNVVSLFVSVHLEPLMSGDPPAHSAESIVAMLFAPEVLAIAHEMSRIATLHRPEAGTLSSLDSTLERALIWGDTSADEVDHLWHTGFDESKSGLFIARFRKVASGVRQSSSLSAKLHNLDESVGCAGRARAWLAIACAAKYVPWTERRQIVVGLDDDVVEIAVVRHPNFT